MAGDEYNDLLNKSYYVADVDKYNL